MPNVAFVRRDLASVIPQYELIRDVISGEVAVKRARDKYLPIPNPHDTSKENKGRYENYIKRAVFYNVGRRTLHGLVGQVFMREAEIKLPPSIEILLDNATGGGVTLIQLAKMALQTVLAYSRGGIFVDYPATDVTEGATVADIDAGRIRPTIYSYSPFEIVNWRVVEDGANEKLSLVVLYESFCYFDDGFEKKDAAQFRVLQIDPASGFYRQSVWREPMPTDYTPLRMPKNSNFQIAEEYWPKGPDGKNLTEIPFSFVGAENNDPAIDDPIFYDLCSINLAHYRNSADYEEACYITGQPTPVLTGLTEDWVKEQLGGKVELGSRAAIPLPVGGDAKLLQAEEKTMLKEAMDAKERQMVALGAKLVEDKQTQRTAFEVSVDQTAETSTLATVTKNVASALTKALGWAAMFAGDPGAEASIALNTDFDLSKLTPEERASVLSAWAQKAISWTEMRTAMRAGGIATQDDKVAKAEIDAETAVEMEREMVMNPPKLPPGA